MNLIVILTALVVALVGAAPASAQEKDSSKDRGGIGGVLDTLGGLLGSGTSNKLHGAVVGHLPGAVGEGGHLLSDVGLEDLVVVVDERIMQGVQIDEAGEERGGDARERDRPPLSIASCRLD